jgi:tetratricopeptide (TPR) repeat protein
MTTRTEARAEKSFVSALLPWLVAASVVVIYLLTLNHWLSFKNLQSVAEATGQAWMPQMYLPLFTLVTSPFHWLPETWVPLAMNLFSTVCAFFVLALLARSVALLPQDRTSKQREREKGAFGLLSIPTSWIPPVLAVLVCGLQLTFWENATTLSSGMFDLLLFAYSVRCLLEYRITKRESWLLRAAVVYAAAATDTWLLIALFPGFLAAIIWVRGFAFFQLRFLARLFLCVLAGLLIYLYLPLIHLRSDGFFWVPLKQNVAAEFSQIRYIFRYTPHYVQFLLVLTSLLPILAIAIRWKSSFGDTSQLGILLATWVFHLANAALLIVCIWAAFDTGFGLRDPTGRFPILDWNRERFLVFYYLGALSIGYFSGYFLLVFKPLARRGHRPTTAQKALNAASVFAICALLVLAPLALLYKNVPEIRVTNGPAMRNYASMLTENFPSEGVILGDDASSLLISESWLARSGKAKNFVFLDTHSIKYPAYYRFQTRKNHEVLPQLSTNVSDRALIGDLDTLALVAKLAEKHPVYYLQPSFGYYFEVFYAVPHGLSYELKRYATNTTVSTPPLPDAVMAENEAFWKEHDPEIRALLPSITDPAAEPVPNFRQRWMTALHIPFEKNSDAVQLGALYSRALNTWAVHEQRLGRLEPAGAHFDEASQLYPGNVVARANSEFNAKLRKGERVTVDNPRAFEDRFGKFSDWQQILEVNGMFDEPTGCLAEGIVFARGRLDREAAQCLQRSLTLAPESVLARLWLARVYLVSREPAQAYPMIEQLKERSNSFADAAITPADVFQLEMAAYYANTNLDKLHHLLSTTLSKEPPDNALLDAAARVSVVYGDYTNALLVADKQLQISPDNLTSLVNKGFVELQLKNFDEAIPPLSRALSLQPTNSPALFCRAMAYLQTDKLDESQRDYETLQKMNPHASAVYHGLAEIASRKKDTNAAIRYYELDLTNVPPNSAEAKFAAERLKSLKPASP